MASVEPIVIVGAARTPIGSFQGRLKSLSALLGAHTIRAVLERAGSRSGYRMGYGRIYDHIFLDGLKRGVASLYIGGGEAIAIALERV